MSGTPEPTFEELQRELAAIVGRLEQGDVPVDEAIALSQRGQEVYRLCVSRLEAAELQIEELTRADEAPGPSDPEQPTY